jgi:hypothetical protein
MSSELAIVAMFHRTSCSKTKWVSFLLDSENTCICMNFEQLYEIRALQLKGEQKLFFQLFKCPMLFFFPFKRQVYFQEVEKRFHHLQESFCKF